MIKSIVLLDDDKILSTIFIRMLEKMGLNVNLSIFNSPIDFLEHMYHIKMANEKVADIILIDINMPSFTGWEVIEKLEKDYSHNVTASQIFMLSSSDSSHDIEKSKSYPLVTDYLVKPLSKESIHKLIE